MKMKWYLSAGALLGASCLFAYAEKEETPPKNDLVAHEWGTFTAVIGSDGREVPWWTPALEGPAALPEFVGSPMPFLAGKSGAFALPKLLRMETPVIYFYADRPKSLIVSVDDSLMPTTEVYPAVDEGVKNRQWTVEIRPPRDEIGRLMPVVGERGAHYAHAREVPEAWWVAKTAAKGKKEVEKFIFYRGAGQATMPRRILRMEEDGIIAKQGRGALFLIEMEASAGLRWTRIGPGAVEADEAGVIRIPRPAADPDARRDEPTLVAALADELAAAGLTRPEAAAMVKTWREAWLGEKGLRVLEVLPREWVDSTLPLTISPAPASLERVFVGRWEILTPLIEQQVRDALELTGGPEARIEALRKLDLRRFGMAAFDRAAQIRDAQFRADFFSLMWSLNQPSAPATVTAK